MSHSISIARAGYAPWTREVFAESGKESQLDARLTALLVDVRIQGQPADAEVFVNGTSRGPAPASLQLPASRHHIEVRKEGFKTFVTDVVLAPGIARTLDFKLRQSEGRGRQFAAADHHQVRHQTTDRARRHATRQAPIAASRAGVPTKGHTR